MTKTLSTIAIISIGAFAGNMINIGLSYGLHWRSLTPVEFMDTFAVDFPLLLGPTVVTLLPAFIVTAVLYFLSNKGSDAKRYWLFALVGLLIVNVQTAVYHLPLNLQFISQSIDPAIVGARLQSWLLFHWIRVAIAIVVGVFAIKAFESSLNNEK
ncbi:MAG: anthrone oxygenase family protein [Chloroflexota bacterium]